MRTTGQLAAVTRAPRFSAAPRDKAPIERIRPVRPGNGRGASIASAVLVSSGRCPAEAAERAALSPIPVVSPHMVSDVHRPCPAGPVWRASARRLLTWLRRSVSSATPLVLALVIAAGGFSWEVARFGLRMPRRRRTSSKKSAARIDGDSNMLRALGAAVASETQLLTDAAASRDRLPALFDRLAPLAGPADEGRISATVYVPAGAGRQLPRPRVE